MVMADKPRGLTPAERDAIDEAFWRSVEAGPDYEVTCARCGKVLLASDAVPEEGDEWECLPCWERCEAVENRTFPVEMHRCA
jgi:hypothetical protein